MLWGGVYEKAQEVTLEVSDNRDDYCRCKDYPICMTYGYTYYTIDGSIPTTSSQLYDERFTGPILIANDTILNFFTVDCKGNQETVNSETYVISAPEKHILPSGIINMLLND